ncbi:PKD domain-containing protein [Haloarcula sp. CBA1130]|nr:PKD domain-containing protein [Haloarcula sp. CBA1129]KAA9401881.1 PKD domain-containing protein [Haloarcula sp. CBA1130]
MLGTNSSTAKLGVVALGLLMLVAAPVMAAQATLVTMDAGSDFSGNESSATTVSYNSTGAQITEGGSYTSTAFSLNESADTFEYNVSSLGANATLELYDASDDSLINSKEVSATGSGSFDVSSSSATSVYVVIDVPDDGDTTSGETTTVDSVSLVAANDAPTADFSDSDNQASAGVSESVTLDASASSDPDDADTISYEWDLDGDGTFDDATGSTATVSESSTGTYEYDVRVSDGNGATDSATFTLTVEENTGGGGSGSVPSNGVLAIIGAFAAVFIVISTLLAVQD